MALSLSSIHTCCRDQILSNLSKALRANDEENAKLIVEEAIENYLGSDLDALTHNVIIDTSSDCVISATPHNFETLNGSVQSISSSQSYTFLRDIILKSKVKNGTMKRGLSPDTPHMLEKKVSLPVVTPTSFSLFDMLDQQPLQDFGQRVTVESILECYDNHDKIISEDLINMLEQLDHVEDMRFGCAANWLHLNKILARGLKLKQMTEHFDVAIAIRFSNLHLSIFSAFGPDCISMRVQIFLNLAESILDFFKKYYIALPENKDLKIALGKSGDRNVDNNINLTLLEFIAHQMRILMKMMKPVARSIESASDEERDNIYVMVFTLLRNIRVVSSNECGEAASFLLPAHFLGLLDPFAEWFAMLCRQISALQLNQYLLHTGLIFDLTSRCCSTWEKQKSPKSKQTNAVAVSNQTPMVFPKPVRVNMVFLTGSHQNNSANNAAVADLDNCIFMQSLSMLSSISLALGAIFPLEKVHFDVFVKDTVRCEKSVGLIELYSLLERNNNSYDVDSFSGPTQTYNDALRLFNTHSKPSPYVYQDMNDNYVSIDRSLFGIIKPFFHVLRICLLNSSENIKVSDNLLDVCEEGIVCLLTKCGGSLIETQFRLNIFHSYVIDFMIPRINSALNVPDKCLSPKAMTSFVRICINVFESENWTNIKLRSIKLCGRQVYEQDDAPTLSFNDLIDTFLETLLVYMRQYCDFTSKDIAAITRLSSNVSSFDHLACIISLLQPITKSRLLLGLCFRHSHDSSLLQIFKLFQEWSHKIGFSIEASSVLSSFPPQSVNFDLPHNTCVTKYKLLMSNTFPLNIEKFFLVLNYVSQERSSLMLESLYVVVQNVYRNPYVFKAVLHSNVFQQLCSKLSLYLCAPSCLSSSVREIRAMYATFKIICDSPHASSIFEESTKIGDNDVGSKLDKWNKFASLQYLITLLRRLSCGNDHNPTSFVAFDL